MSHYIGYSGQAVIKKEYRKEFGCMFRREFDRVQSPLLCAYLEAHEGGCLYLEKWEQYPMNDCFEELLPTKYDEDTGEFIYGVVFNMHNWGMFYAVTELLKLLPELTGELLSYMYWDEFADEGRGYDYLSED